MGSGSTTTSRRSFDSGLRSGGRRLALGVTQLVRERGASTRPNRALLTDYCERLGRRSCPAICMISPMLKPLQSWALSTALSSASVFAVATVRKHRVQIESNVPFGFRRCGNSGRDDRNMGCVSYTSGSFNQAIRTFSPALRTKDGHSCSPLCRASAVARQEYSRRLRGVGKETFHPRRGRRFFDVSYQAVSLVAIDGLTTFRLERITKSSS